MRKLLLLLAVLGMALPAWGRSEKGGLQVCATRASVTTDFTCGPKMSSDVPAGARVIILDAASATDCTGGGSVTTLCEWNGSALLAVNPPLANGETIINSTEGTFTFTRDETGTVTLTCADDDANCSLTISAGGVTSNLLLDSATNGAITIGTADTGIITLVNNGALTLGAAATTNSVDIESAGAITLEATGPINIGDSSATSVPVVTDGGTVTIDGTIAAAADVTVDDSQTEAFGAANEYGETRANLNQIVGIPKLGVTYIAALNNGTASVAAADPSIADCSAIVNGAEADNTTISVTGNSYQYTWAADVATDDGIDCVIAYPATDDVDSFGFWFRTDTAIASGDIHINFDDGGVEECSYETFAVTTLDEWQWVELDVSTVCNAKGDGTDGVEFLATAQGAGAAVLDDAIMYIDHMAMWKVGDEDAIGDIRVGGLIDFAYGKDAADQVNKLVAGVEWASHFINYQSGADAIVPITDLSTFWGKTLEALE